MSQTVVLNLVYLLVGKLRLLADLFKGQLMGEFYFHREVQEEWAQDMLPRLMEASWPLKQFLAGQPAEQQNTEFGRCWAELSFFESEINSAVEILRREASALDAIFASASHVVNASHRLKRWQEWLRDIGVDTTYALREVEGKVVLPHETVTELHHALDEAEKAFENAITQRSDLAICRASRLLFLLCFVASVTATELWNQVRRSRVIGNHEKAVTVMTDREPRVHTLERLTKMRELTPERCEEIVRGKRLIA